MQVQPLAAHQFQLAAVAPSRFARLLRIFGVEAQHANWRICAEAGRVWRRESETPLAAGDRGLVAAARVPAGRGIALWPGDHVAARGASGPVFDLDDAWNEAAPPGALDASAIADARDPSRSAHLVRPPPTGQKANVAPAAFRWRDVFMGADDDAPLNASDMLCYDAEGGLTLDPAGAVLVALETIEAGDELFLAEAPHLPEPAAIVIDAPDSEPGALVRR